VNDSGVVLRGKDAEQVPRDDGRAGNIALAARGEGVPDGGRGEEGEGEADEDVEDDAGVLALGLGEGGEAGQDQQDLALSLATRGAR
jgi:hypothetical protein